MCIYREKERERDVCVCVCVCARAHTWTSRISTAFQRSSKYMTCMAKVLQGFTETSVLQEHRWAFIMQIVQRIHDCVQPQS